MCWFRSTWRQHTRSWAYQSKWLWAWCFLWGVSMLTNCGSMEDVGIMFNKMWSLGLPWYWNMSNVGVSGRHWNYFDKWNSKVCGETLLLWSDSIKAIWWEEEKIVAARLCVEINWACFDKKEIIFGFQGGSSLLYSSFHLSFMGNSLVLLAFTFEPLVWSNIHRIDVMIAPSSSEGIVVMIRELSHLHSARLHAKYLRIKFSWQ